MERALGLAARFSRQPEEATETILKLMIQHQEFLDNEVMRKFFLLLC